MHHFFRNGIRCLAILSTTASVHATLYTVTDVGTFGGSEGSARDINNNGIVLGNALTAGDYRPALWSPTSGLTELNIASWASALNDAGAVVGGSEEFGPYFFWSAATGMVDPAPTRVHDINAAGQVVGSQVVRYVESTGPWGTITDEVYGAVIWTADGGTVLLGAGDADPSRGYLINDAGQVLGKRWDPDFDQSVWFLWSESTGMEPVPGADDEVNFLALNDMGQAVGWAYLPTLGDVPVLWSTATGLVPLPTFLNGEGLAATSSSASDINNLGQAVGHSSFTEEWTDSTDRAFVWTAADGTRDLNGLLVDGDGWTLLDARAINDLGQIVGNGIYNGQRRAFLLTPVPEPTLAAALPALALLSRSRRPARERGRR